MELTVLKDEELFSARTIDMLSNILSLAESKLENFVPKGEFYERTTN
jgi:hypothetical protein